MKKTVLAIVFLIFVFIQTASAQFGLKLAPVTGLNFNIGTGSDLEKTATGFGMVIGAQTDMRFTPVIGILATLQFYDNRSISYSQQGTIQGIAYTQRNSFGIGYFIIEPLLKLSIPGSGFYFIAGPTLGINIQGSVEARLTSQDGQITFQDGSTRIRQSLQDTNPRFEMRIGAGFDIPVSSWIDLSPQFAFGFGITNVLKDTSARILTFQLTTGVKFKLI